MSEKTPLIVDAGMVDNYLNMHLSDEQLQQLAIYIAEHLIKRG